MFGKQKIKVKCPECKREFKVKLSQAENEEEVKCPGCGRRFRLKKPIDSVPTSQ